MAQTAWRLCDLSAAIRLCGRDSVMQVPLPAVLCCQLYSAYCVNAEMSGLLVKPEWLIVLINNGVREVGRGFGLSVRRSSELQYFSVSCILSGHFDVRELIGHVSSM